MSSDPTSIPLSVRRIAHIPSSDSRIFHLADSHPDPLLMRLVNELYDQCSTYLYYQALTQIILNFANDRAYSPSTCGNATQTSTSLQMPTPSHSQDFPHETSHSLYGITRPHMQNSPQESHHTGSLSDSTRQQSLIESMSHPSVSSMAVSADQIANPSPFAIA